MHENGIGYTTFWATKRMKKKNKSSVQTFIVCIFTCMFFFYFSFPILPHIFKYLLRFNGEREKEKQATATSPAQINEKETKTPAWYMPIASIILTILAIHSNCGAKKKRRCMHRARFEMCFFFLFLCPSCSCILWTLRTRAYNSK